MHRGTTSIPIVMATSGYPVEAGLAHSLARPGKNVTGNAAYEGQGIWSKLVQLLRDTKPEVHNVGVLWTYLPPLFPREEIDQSYAELRDAQRSLGVNVHIVEAAQERLRTT
jgi:putative tryptophan/tyrosine transport system substrate-binding protein